MKKLCVAIGVAALLCSAVNADPQMATPIPIDPAKVIMKTDGVSGPDMIGTLPVKYGPMHAGKQLEYSVKTHETTVAKEGDFGTAAIVEVYSNLSSPTAYFSLLAGDKVGDVIVPIQGDGSLESISFTIYNAGLADPNDPNNLLGDNLATLDVEITLFNDPNMFNDPNAAMITYTGTIDFTGPNDPGLPAGYFSTLTFSDLAADPNFIVYPDCEFLAIQSWTAATWSGTSPGELGALFMHPPDIGYSADFAFVDEAADPNDAGMYVFGVFANFGWAISENDPPTECPTPGVVYANTINGIWGSDDVVPGFFADEIDLIGGGLLTTLSTTFWCWHPSGSGVGSAAITSAEITIELRRTADAALLGSFSRTLDYSGPNEALPHSYFSVWTFSGLETENINLSSRNIEARMVVHSLTYDNPDPNSWPGWGQIVYVDPNHNYCQGTTYVAQENPVGTSDQGFSNSQGNWWYGPCQDPNTAVPILVRVPPVTSTGS